ncbi:MAG: nitroreductase family protein [Atopococcus tabaci]|uniref:Nitroreductase family protein n=1 Tax=Atopococcus tabaci TaxID=269774 RepID=A0AA43UCC2_9LACT|nr:nitroreductase family protein [Atopococcus tabaci]
MSNFTDLQAKRRSTYVIGKNTDLSKEEITEALREAAKNVPSSFNSQTTRLILVFDDANERVWKEIHDVQKDVLDGAVWERMSGVIQGAGQGVGTILFFEDRDAVKENIPAAESQQNLYKQHNDAFQQYSAWLALTELGLGGTLQHFNIGYEQGFDKVFRELLNLPESYEMVAQMPFGSIEQEYEAKDYIDSDLEVQVFTEVK